MKRLGAVLEVDILVVLVAQQPHPQGLPPNLVFKLPKLGKPNAQQFQPQTNQANPAMVYIVNQTTVLQVMLVWQEIFNNLVFLQDVLCLRPKNGLIPSTKQT